MVKNFRMSRRKKRNEWKKENKEELILRMRMRRKKSRITSDVEFKSIKI